MSPSNYELMYRRPDGEKHEHVAKVLDDILIRLAKLEEEQAKTHNS